MNNMHTLGLMESINSMDSTKLMQPKELIMTDEAEGASESHDFLQEHWL